MKKNLAIVMSAVTAVGAVAPVVANAAITEKGATRDEVIKEAQKALDTKYSDKKEYGSDDAEVKADSSKLDKDVARSVYKVYLVTDATNLDAKKGDLLAALENVQPSNTLTTKRVQDVKEIREAADSGKKFKVVIVDKGHAKVDGKVVYKRDINKVVYAEQTETDKKVTFTDALTVNDTNVARLLKNAIKTVAVYDKYGEYVKDITVNKTENQPVLDTSELANAGKVVLTLKTGKTVELKLGEAAYDFSVARNAAGEKLDLNNKKDDLPSVAETVTSFDLKALDEDDDEVTQEVAVVGGDATIYDISKMARTLEYKVEDIYSNETGYSEKGADAVNAVIRLAKKKDGQWRKANLSGVNYIRTANAQEIKDEDLVVDYVDGQYVLKVKIDKAVDTVDSQLDNPVEQDLDIIFKGKSLSEVNKIRDDIKAGEDVVPGKFDKIVGKNRFQTAIEISKERFKDNVKADAVVIVGANAITDGLAAAPLAAAKNAPVLLAGKNKLDVDTMAEIKRAVDDIKNKKVYIVGGKSSVSEEVEAQLKSEFNVVPVRLSGSDRYATSIEIAKRLYDDQNTLRGAGKVFFTGGTGAADAMSISAEASKVVPKDGFNKVSPIIIMKKDGFDRETRRTIGLIAARGTQSYVIGGTGTVSYAGMQELNKTVAVNEAAGDLAAKRISGKNRYATNADVITTFYKGNKGEALPRVYVASAFDNYLVDAQTAGALAAAKNAPILLVGNKLDKAQADLFTKKVKTDDYNYFVKEGLNKEGQVENDGKFGTKLTQVGGAASATALREIVKALGL